MKPNWKLALNALSWPWKNETKEANKPFTDGPVQLPVIKRNIHFWMFWLWHPSSPIPRFSPRSGLSLNKVRRLPPYVPTGRSEHEKQDLPQFLAKIKAMANPLPSNFTLDKTWALLGESYCCLLCAINFILCKLVLCVILPDIHVKSCPEGLSCIQPA